MGKLERQIMIGALTLVGILVAVVVLEGLQPRGGAAEGADPGGSGVATAGARGEWQPLEPPPMVLGPRRPVVEEVAVPSPRSAAARRSEPAAETRSLPTARERSERPPVPVVEVAPASAPRTAPAGAAPRTYVVQEGDTLWDVCIEQLGSPNWLDALKAANPSLDPDRLEPGTVLRLPDVGRSGSARKTAEAAAEPAPRPGEKVHVVAANDSLWTIAERYYGRGDLYGRIVAANPDKLKDENTVLKLGWKLRIPDARP